jgi:hypothetical protein
LNRRTPLDLLSAELMRYPIPPASAIQFARHCAFCSSGSFAGRSIGGHAVLQQKPIDSPKHSSRTAYTYSLLIETATLTSDERSVIIRAGEVVVVDFTTAASSDRLASR